jgi:hypothetical protein
MKEIEFATAGKVHIVSNMNGAIIFTLDPVLPYRLDFTPLDKGVFTLLVRQGIGIAEHVILPDNSVGIVNSSVEFCYKGTCLQEGQLVRILITLDELKRYMSLSAGAKGHININGIV